MNYRLQRLFNASSGRCLDIAVDHGLFGEPAFLAGIENMPATVESLVRAHPDAIQLSLGQAPLLQGRPGRDKPALILRADVANVYGSPTDEQLFSHHLPDAVEQAVRLDAVAVVANLLQLPGRPGLREQSIETILALRGHCTRFGMPLMVEPLVMRNNAQAGAYMVDGDVHRVVPLVRQARELGADLIKADFTTDLSEYHRVVEAAQVPLLVRGGGRTTDAELLTRTEEVLRQGAAGLVYGRNIIQHPDPVRMTHALMAMLHEGSSRQEALAILRRSGQ